jgi:hypothetical protein
MRFWILDKIRAIFSVRLLREYTHKKAKYESLLHVSRIQQEDKTQEASFPLFSENTDDVMQCANYDLVLFGRMGTPIVICNS